MAQQTITLITTGDDANGFYVAGTVGNEPYRGFNFQGVIIDAELMSEETGVSLGSLYIDKHTDDSPVTYSLYLQINFPFSTQFENNGSLTITDGTRSAVVNFDGTQSRSQFYAYEEATLGPIYENLGEASNNIVLLLDDGAAGDAVSPTVSGTPETSTDGATVAITFSEELDTAHEPANGDFNVQVAGSRRNVTDVAIAGAIVTLTLASAVTAGQAVTVAYTPPGNAGDTSRLQDAAGNEVAAITATTVTNRRGVTDSTAPTLSTATVDGSTLVLTYDEALDAAHEPPNSAFSARVGGFGRAVSNVAIAGMTVTLTLLGTAVTAGQTVVVTYTPPGNAGNTTRLQDAAGNEAGGLTNQAVQNNTGGATTPPGPVTNLAETTVTQVAITWDWDAVTGATSYEYRVALGSASFSGNWVSVAALTAVTVDRLTAGTEYKIQVRARNTAGTGNIVQDTATTNNPALPSLVWTPAAPTLEAGEVLWRAERRIEGAPMDGDAVTANWLSPVVVGRYGRSGVEGEDGDDGAGIEFIFARTANTTAPAAPSNGWGFDTPGSAAGADTLTPSTVWFDGAPTVNAANPFLWMSQRPVPGFPAVGSKPSGTGDWSTPRIIARFGPTGAAGTDGDTGEVGPTGPTGPAGPRTWERVYSGTTTLHGSPNTPVVSWTITDLADYDMLAFVTVSGGFGHYLNSMRVTDITTGTGTPPFLGNAIAIDELQHLSLLRSGDTLRGKKWTATGFAAYANDVKEIWGVNNPT